jgi:putative transposase
VLDALDMALVARKPDNVVHHSDRGSQYTSVAFGNRCKEAGVRPSTGSVGDAYDNAMCESFFATLECELIDRRRFRSHRGADGRLSIHRRLLQSLTPPLSPGLSFAHRIRKET